MLFNEQNVQVRRPLLFRLHHAHYRMYLSINFHMDEPALLGMFHYNILLPHLITPQPSRSYPLCFGPPGKSGPCSFRSVCGRHSWRIWANIPSRSCCREVLVRCALPLVSCQCECLPSQKLCSLANSLKATGLKPLQVSLRWLLATTGMRCGSSM